MCTAEQLRRHYEIERPLATVLRAPSREERPGLYNRLYDELYRLAPDHPQLLRRGAQHNLEEARGVPCCVQPSLYDTQRARNGLKTCV